MQVRRENGEKSKEKKTHRQNEINCVFFSRKCSAAKPEQANTRNSNNNHDSHSTNNSNSNESNRNTIKQLAGDWVCGTCQELNFASRVACRYVGK